MTNHRCLCAFAALAAAAALNLPARAYYVSDVGIINAQAGVNDPTKGTTQGTFNNGNNSGHLTQLTTGGTLVANVAGSAFDGNVNVGQTTEGHIEDTAEIGKLHSTISAACSTGLSASSNFSGDAFIGTSTDVSWNDNVHFHSNNPNGSDFTLSISLDDAINLVGGQLGFNSGTYIGTASAAIAFNSDSTFFPTTNHSPALRVQDNHSLSPDGSRFDQFPTNRTASVTFHLVGDGMLDITSDLSCNASANQGIGQSLVNAGNTASFNITTTDPLASYTTDSGTIFSAEPTPEPASLSLLTLSLPLLLRRRS